MFIYTNLVLITIIELATVEVVSTDLSHLCDNSKVSVKQSLASSSLLYIHMTL